MSRTEHLVRTMVDLADTLADDFDVLELLQVLVERATRLAESAAAGVLLTTEREELSLAAASSGAMRSLEMFELQAEGALLRCLPHGQPGDRDRPDDARRSWPNFVALATEAGYSSVIAHPSSRRGQRIGGLNVLRDQPGAFDDEALAIVRGLAEIAAVGILTERTLRSADARIAHQRYALESRASVEQAKGILAERFDISPPLAFELLRRYARSRNERLRDVGDQLISGEIDPTRLRELH